MTKITDFTENSEDLITATNNLDLKKCRFSAREIFVLYEVICGQKNQAIAKKLYLSYHTVKFHIQKLLDKTNSRNRTELSTKILVKLINKNITPELLAEHFC